MPAKKKATPSQSRIVRPRGTPVPMPEYKPKRVPGRPLPAPMPTVEGNYGKPRVKPRPMPAGPKKSGSSTLVAPKRIKKNPARRKMI
jgi:hypothetical protein